jgi:hypothetical protein
MNRLTVDLLRTHKSAGQKSKRTNQKQKQLIMKTLPSLLASLSLITGMVSCVGPMPMPMHPGANVSLHNSFPSVPSHQVARPSAPLNVNPRYIGLPATPVAQFATPVSFNPRVTDFVSQAIARPTVPVSVNPRVVNLGGGSDYQPHLASEYRNGWRAGAQDAAYGANRDYRRAYACQGTGWESYFQEGYNDGYEGRGLAH